MESKLSKKHLGNFLEDNYTAQDDVQHSSLSCPLCLTESHNWLCFSQHGRLFILNSYSIQQYISLWKGECLPICQLFSCNLPPGPKPLKGSSRPFPKLPIEEQKQYHFWKTPQSFLKPCRPSSPYTFTSVILHKLKYFSTSNMFCQVVFS